MNTEQAIRETIYRLASLLEVRIEIRAIVEEEGRHLVRIDSPESRLLIGARGETLRAFQHLVSTLVRELAEEESRITVDVGGYLERQEERLRREAEEGAHRALETGREVALRPMNAAERRIIHLALQERGGVKTSSTGEGKSRRVVIWPEKD